MAHSHYVMDLYFPDDGGPEGFRREALRIEAADDDEALAECKRIDSWKRPSFYEVRSIRATTRSSDKIIYSSRAAE
ncbi:MAG: hypothetical protein ABI398_05105 [Devosia sp.]